MSEFKQQNKNYVSPEEYIDSKPWRASGYELAETMHDTDEENRARGRFTMRLLDRNNLDAQDHLAEVVAADTLGEDGMNGPLSVTLRPVLREGKRGDLQTVMVSADGIILNSNPNTSNFEKGYFVGGASIGEDELQNFDMQILVPKEKTALKAMSAPVE